MAKTDFTQDALSIARELVDKFNRRDYAAILEDGDGAVDYTEVGTGRHITDPDEMVANLEAWVAGFPDVRGTVTSALRDGDRLAFEITWEGTHDGPLVTPSGTLPATGNRISTRAVQLATLEGGRIVSTTHYLDVMTLMTQLTSIPAPSTGAQAGAPANA